MSGSKMQKACHYSRPADDIWVRTLKEAIADPALVAFRGNTKSNSEVEAAAYKVANCLGYCRLFQVVLPKELNRVIPAIEAMAAAEELIRLLASWTMEAELLPSYWDTASVESKEDCCLSIFMLWINAQVTYLMIKESYENCKTNQELQTQAFNQVMERLLDSLNHFDGVLKRPEILARLSILAGNQFLQICFDLARVSNNNSLPWWVDGTFQRWNRRSKTVSSALMQG